MGGQEDALGLHVAAWGGGGGQEDALGLHVAAWGARGRFGTTCSRMGGKRMLWDYM